MMKAPPDGMAQLLALRLQVAAVLGVRTDLDRHLLDYRQTESVKAHQLLRIVRENADRGQAEVGEDLIADAVVARVGGKPELEVRLDRVHPRLLQLVGAQLVEKADPATLLRHIEKDAAPLRLDLRERLLELLAAVAAQRVEHIAGEALGVDAHEDVLCAVDLAHHEREMRLAGELLAERDPGELAVLGRQAHGRAALDKLLVTAAILDDV